MISTCKILVINVGSTSVKLGVFEDGVCVSFDEYSFDGKTGCSTVKHVVEIVRGFLDSTGHEARSFQAISARSGILRPVKGGTYRVNARLLHDVAGDRYGKHASNLSSQVADILSREWNVPAYIVDPITTDELDDDVRLTGIPCIERKSVFHALSQKAAARKAAEEAGRIYQDCRIIVAHMGGGVSVGAHLDGMVVDVGDALGGDGPMAPERAGNVPAVELVRMCFSGQYDKNHILDMFRGDGGVVAHLGTRDMRIVEDMIAKKDVCALQVMRALELSVSRSIGARAVYLGGHIDCIVLTGGLSRWRRLVDGITSRVAFLAPVKVYTENLEMEALAAGVLRVLQGIEKALEY